MSILKKIGRSLVCSILEWQVRRLRAKHTFSIIAVAGSVGKTSTKLVIAQLLAQSKKVMYQEGNYNDRATVPLVLFGQKLPSLFNPIAWAKIFASNERQLRQPYPYKYAVLELGTDGPGFMAEFAYLRPELGVITSIAPEHMTYFKTIEAVAQEEMTISTYATKLLINVDDVEARFLPQGEYVSYGSQHADYVIKSEPRGLDGQTLTLQGLLNIQTNTTYLGEQGAKILLGAIAAVHMVGLTPEEIVRAVPAVRPFSGRMQVLHGIRDSRIIDDTYNASPIAVRAALDVLFSLDAPQKIAILGTMNELGALSEHAHHDIGMYCDPAKLDLMVTIGSDANTFLASVARERGCTVYECDSPYEAGVYVAERLIEGAVILVKGSQNRVFAEESIKPLLEKSADASLLVRQSAYWMDIKRQQFPDEKS